MKRYRNLILTLLALAGIATLFWKKTMAAQLATCEVCVVFNGQRQCSKVQRCIGERGGPCGAVHGLRTGLERHERKDRLRQPPAGGAAM